MSERNTSVDVMIERMAELKPTYMQVTMEGGCIQLGKMELERAEFDSYVAWIAGQFWFNLSESHRRKRNSCEACGDVVRDLENA